MIMKKHLENLEFIHLYIKTQIRIRTNMVSYSCKNSAHSGTTVTWIRRYMYITKILRKVSIAKVISIGFFVQV